MGIMGSLWNPSKKDLVDKKVASKEVAAQATNASIRSLRNNPKCTYDTCSGEMEWAGISITPGDYIRIKHRNADGYNRIELDEAGMFLGVQGDDIVFQMGVRKQKAHLFEIHTIEVMSRIEENIEE